VTPIEITNTIAPVEVTKSKKVEAKESKSSSTPQALGKSVKEDQSAPKHREALSLLGGLILAATLVSKLF